MRSHPMWVRGLKPLQLLEYNKHRKSHPMWVRGLKQTSITKDLAQVDVAPHVGAWIETSKPAAFFCEVGKSHPMWVRGLKHEQFVIYTFEPLSHPMWVRGLKQLQRVYRAATRDVAPHVGAWIETKDVANGAFLTTSHPMWVRGLKLKC